MVKPYIKGADRCIFTHIHLKTQVGIYILWLGEYIYTNLWLGEYVLY